MSCSEIIEADDGDNDDDDNGDGDDEGITIALPSTSRYNLLQKLRVCVFVCEVQSQKRTGQHNTLLVKSIQRSVICATHGHSHTFQASKDHRPQHNSCFPTIQDASLRL